MRPQRVTGDRLQRIRKRWFALHPLCVHCVERGIMRLATELDHVVPLFKGGDDDDSNRQGLCRDCHTVKTAKDRGWVQRLGCDDTGRPVDPNHPWNMKRSSGGGSASG